MTDVRLTALNPVDSLVYPVACNTSGELLVADDGIDYLPLAGGTLTGGLTGTTATFAGDVSCTKVRNNTAGSGNGQFEINPSDSTVFYSYRVRQTDNSLCVDTQSTNEAFVYGVDGSATFSGNVFIGGTTAGTATIELNTNGSTTFAGQMFINCQNSTVLRIRQGPNGANKIVLQNDGSATFAGNVTAPNITSLNTLVEELQTKMSLILRQIDISAETP